MSVRRGGGPEAGPDGVIAVRISSERLRRRLLSISGRKDFRETVNEAFSVGARELKGRTLPVDDALPTWGTDGTTEELSALAGAVDKNFVATEELNDALCAFMDAYLGRPDGTVAHVPRFLRKPEREGVGRWEPDDPDDEP